MIAPVGKMSHGTDVHERVLTPIFRDDCYSIAVRQEHEQRDNRATITADVRGEGSGEGIRQFSPLKPPPLGGFSLGHVPLANQRLRNSDCTESTFRQSPKTFFFNQYLRVAAH